MARLRDRVAEVIRDQRLWSAGERVAVAVSGGLDSVALLHLLLRTRGRHQGELSVITIDHGTREHSGRDADFVLELAGQLELEAQRVSLDLGSSASEATCREARYAVFETLSVHAVALAHHRDDQAETVLLRLLRGAGTRGLSGMAARRGRYVRPLLGLPRAELHAWAVSQGLSWREDPSNAEPRFLRNRVRHELIPLLEALRPGASAALSRSASLAAEDEALLHELAAQQLPIVGGALSTPALVEAPRPIARRALIALCGHISASQIDAVLAAADRGRGRVHLSGTTVVRIDGASVSLYVPA